MNADFALHMAIAQATNNSRFVEFMSLVGPDAIPRASLKITPEPDYLEQISLEHERIVSGISNRESDVARAAMREHLANAQKRYRALLTRG